jgi:predicted nuclease of predicted toxin-antitoxin system
MVKLHADENLPIAVVRALRDHGYDINTAEEVGRAGQAIPDRDVLEYATVEGRAVITLNRRDFIRLHQDVPNHAGIIVCTVDPNSKTLADRVHAALNDLEHLTGRIIRINRSV